MLMVTFYYLSMPDCYRWLKSDDSLQLVGTWKATPLNPMTTTNLLVHFPVKLY